MTPFGIYPTKTKYESPNLPSADVYWLLKFFSILTEFGVLFLFGYLLIHWVRHRAKEKDRYTNSNCCFRFLYLFTLGRPDYQLDYVECSEFDINDGDIKVVENVKFTNRRPFHRQKTHLIQDFMLLLLYFFGIQICLVCMGFFQERIMTKDYSIIGAENNVSNEFFRDAEFLVFANRIIAFLLSGSYLLITWNSQPLHVPPLYLHSFASFSNVISSWCQYEALKYVSFPIQTVCKASKIVPTMLMGKIIRKQRYSAREYLFAFVLVIGASMFFLSMPNVSNLPIHVINGTDFTDNKANDWIKELQSYSGMISGLILMFGYLFFDAFTPNWQKKLFDQSPRISTTQMMVAINAFSSVFCFVSLLHQGTLILSLQFILNHSEIFADCLLLSLGSAFGQIFIYMTIKRFGPVVLSVLMTIRQILSIMLSSIYFAHPINLKSLFGLMLVFTAIFIDIYYKYRNRNQQRVRR